VTAAEAAAEAAAVAEAEAEAEAAATIDVAEDTYICPYTIVIDSREQRPFLFTGIRSDARHGKRVLAVQLVRKGLASGDYSLEGFEDKVAVERKGLSDLYSSLGKDRRRFNRELERLAAYDFAAVVIETDWDTIINRPPERSKLRPKRVFRTVIAWQQRYPRVHWWACPGRRFAEIVTLRLLERYWRDHLPPTQTCPPAGKRQPGGRGNGTDHNHQNP
jgi:ERCC4-type nuclease